MSRFAQDFCAPQRVRVEWSRKRRRVLCKQPRVRTVATTAAPVGGVSLLGDNKRQLAARRAPACDGTRQYQPFPIASVGGRVSSLPLHSERRCTVKRAALALAALVASTVALGQRMTSPTPVEPRISTTPREQKAPRMSEADKLALINDCTRQVQAAHPSVPEEDVKADCENHLKSHSSPR